MTKRISVALLDDTVVPVVDTTEGPKPLYSKGWLAQAQIHAKNVILRICRVFIMLNHLICRQILSYIHRQQAFGLFMFWNAAN